MTVSGLTDGHRDVAGGLGVELARGVDRKHRAIAGGIDQIQTGSGKGSFELEGLVEDRHEGCAVGRIHGYVGRGQGDALGPAELRTARLEGVAVDQAGLGSPLPGEIAFETADREIIQLAGEVHHLVNLSTEVGVSSGSGDSVSEDHAARSAGNAR